MTNIWGDYDVIGTRTRTRMEMRTLMNESTIRKKGNRISG